MNEFLLYAADEVDPVHAQFLLFAVGSAILVYANHQLRYGGAYCKTDLTKFSPTRFYPFKEAPIETRFVLLVQFTGAVVMLYFALMGVG